MQRYNEEFLAQLDGFDLDTLEKNPHSIYGLARDLTLNYVNQAWLEFARDNDGEPVISQRFTIGTPIGDAFSEPLKTYYTGIYRRLLESGEVWHHEYECSSPSMHRIYHQTVYPLRNQAGLLVVNSPLVEQAHETAPGQALRDLLDTYRKPNGLLTACCHCRRVHRIPQSGIWDRISQWETAMPSNVNHTLCPICHDYFYRHLYQRTSTKQPAISN
jgi:hypothetical protein